LLVIGLEPINHKKKDFKSFVFTISPNKQLKCK